MNIVVCVKQVPDSRVHFQPNADKSYIETDDDHWHINPEDACAVEQAVGLQERLPGTTITAVRVGGEHHFDALITAMAMGADEAVLVEAPECLDPFRTAKALKGGIEKTGKTFDLVLCGNEAFDDENLQVPQLLAEMMTLPAVTAVIDFALCGDVVSLTRQVEGGAFEIYKVNTPAVVACAYGLNIPRYAPLPLVTCAKKKPYARYTLEEVGVSADDQRLRYTNFRLRPEERAGKRFDATDPARLDEVVTELVETLRADLKTL